MSKGLQESRVMIGWERGKGGGKLDKEPYLHAPSSEIHWSPSQVIDEIKLAIDLSKPHFIGKIECITAELFIIYTKTISHTA